MSSTLDGHLQHFQFPKQVIEFNPKILDGVIGVHKDILKTFIPTAVKLHYNFNLGDRSQVLQRLFLASPATVKIPGLLARLCSTKCVRVYTDRLIDIVDYQKSKDYCIASASKDADAVFDVQVVEMN
jgi:dynein heavy chain